MRILPTDWIFRVTDSADENDLFMLINILHKQPSDALFSTEFVEVLIEEFWERYQFSIFITVFIPFILYAISTVVYFTLNASRMQQSAVLGSMVDSGWIEYISKMLVYSLTFYMFSFEIL